MIPLVDEGIKGTKMSILYEILILIQGDGLPITITYINKEESIGR